MRNKMQETISTIAPWQVCYESFYFRSEIAIYQALKGDAKIRPLVQKDTEAANRPTKVARRLHEGSTHRRGLTAQSQGCPDQVAWL